MKVDLTQDEISWIQHLADRSIGQWEDDLKNKEKNSKIAINAIKQSLKIYNKLEQHG